MFVLFCFNRYLSAIKFIYNTAEKYTKNSIIVVPIEIGKVLTLAVILQVMSVSERGQGQAPCARQTQPDGTSHTLPLRKRPGLLHLRSCGDLSTFTWAELQVSGQSRPSSRANSRTGFRTGSRRHAQERPHSLMVVSRETLI